MQWKSAPRLGLLALLCGATGIGFAPIFVRLSEVGPSATAFYRLLIALPFLWLARSFESARTEPREGESNPNPRTDPSLSKARTPSILYLSVLAGMFFAGDMALWHWSVKLTSVANSTLLTNFAPFFVMIGARVIFGERITVVLLSGMAVASIGAVLLVGASLKITTAHLIGDLLALTTAAFYGGYLLTVKYLRMHVSTVHVMAWSGLVSCLLLLLIALLSRESLQVRSGHGWAVLLGLGLISHLGGQGLIAYALAHLPAGFSSVGLLFQPVVAAALAWMLLAEPLSTVQGCGGVVILLGISLASFGQAK